MQDCCAAELQKDLTIPFVYGIIGYHLKLGSWKVVADRRRADSLMRVTVRGVALGGE